MNKLCFAFREVFDDNTSKICGGKAVSPIQLYNECDGLVPLKEYEELQKKENELTTQNVLFLMAKCFKQHTNFSHCVRLEIINTETNEVVDFINFTNDFTK